MTALGLLAVLAAPSIEGATHAVLVGVTRYENLGPRWQLEGPEHDVGLFAELLAGEPFRVAPDRLTRLAGWPSDPRIRPTRENIERELRRLATITQRGDEVVILLAGHGSQQPARPDAGDAEPDGLDEIFLPADVGAWKGSRGRVERAIVDDELGQWVNAIRARGASVWILVDSCHSGTMTRGVERARSLPPEALGIPNDAFAAVIERPRGRGQRESGFGAAPAGSGQLVAMYASQPYEETPERLFPGPGGRYHGLFSYTVAEVLRQARTPPTYRELAAEVAARYRAMGRVSPTPLLEGDDLDRELLGSTRWPDRPTLHLGDSLNGQADRWSVDAGALDGLTRGSVLAVYAPLAGKAPERILGHVRVVEVDALTASVERVAEHEGSWRAADPALPPFPAGARCAVTFVDLGDLRLRVAATDTDRQAYPADGGPATLNQAIAATVGASRLVERVDQTDHADWLARVAGQEVVLEAVSKPTVEGTTNALKVMRVGRLDAPDLARRLGTALETIARAQNLLALGATTGEFGADAPAVDVAVRRFRDPRDREGTRVDWGPAGRVLRAGDKIAFEIANPNRFAVDVTLLFVDSGFGIRSLFPAAGTTNRLAPGDRVFPVYPTRVTADTLGEETLVAIAVKADGPTRSFASLAQPTLEGYRAAERTRGGDTSASALSRLMESALYGAEGTRGIANDEASTYSISLLPWSTHPAAQEAP